MKTLQAGEYCFDEVFNRIREHLHINTQVHLAEILGVKRQTVSEAKRTTGFFPVKWAAILSEKFNMSIDFILTGSDNKESKQALYKKLLIATEQENAVLKVQLKEQQFLLDRLQSNQSV